MTDGGRAVIQQSEAQQIIVIAFVERDLICVL
jgi:hypothetical protein